MTVATRFDAPTFETDGFVFRPLAVPSRGSAEIALWEVTGGPGVRSVEHSMSREEVFVVTAGTLAATIDGIPVSARIGDAVIVPPGRALQLWNASEVDEVRFTACTSVGMMATVGTATFAPPWAL